MALGESVALFHSYNGEHETDDPSSRGHSHTPPAGVVDVLTSLNWLEHALGHSLLQVPEKQLGQTSYYLV